MLGSGQRRAAHPCRFLAFSFSGRDSESIFLNNESRIVAPRDSAATESTLRNSFLIAGPTRYTVSRRIGGPKVEANSSDVYCPMFNARLAAAAMKSNAGSSARMLGCAI